MEKIPTYTETLGDLGSSISIIHGGGIFNESDEGKGLSIADINEQFKNSNDPIEIFPDTPREDPSFEAFKKSLQNTL
jgi:hypothetical protein